MLGTIVNSMAIIIGGMIGLLLKKGINEKVADTVMRGLGLCTLYIGITGCLKGKNVLITILSIAVGAIVGELLDLDQLLNNLGQKLEVRFASKAKKKGSIASGFISASLLFCVGAMAIVGSLQSGLTGNHEMLFTKSLLDGIASIIFASSLGVGVLFSAALVFVYQGSITLLAQYISPFLSHTVIAEMTCVGSLLIIGLAFNMLKIANIKVMNYVPAIFIPILLCRFM
jgi:Uncharacterized membrane protein, possible Na+ channel or pump